MIAALAERTCTPAEYGWRTTVIGNQLLLTLSQGVVGVSMAAHNAAIVRRQVNELGLVYPMVPLPGPRKVEVFIAAERTNWQVRPESNFAALVLRNTRIPLPPSVIAGSCLRWTVPPGRRVPELDPLMAVIQANEPRRHVTSTW